MIEACRIAGSIPEMKGECTFVAPERQNELTRRIQRKLAKTRRGSLGGLRSQRRAQPRQTLRHDWARTTVEDTGCSLT